MQATAEDAKEAGDDSNGAAEVVRRISRHSCARRACSIPACGTGNFLYVSLELMKRLEGEVLEALLDLGGQEALDGLEGHTVDPHQFLGLEINPRAAAIAELVLWIGYLQWHFRTRAGTPAEPILRAFKNINLGKQAAGYERGTCARWLRTGTRCRRKAEDAHQQRRQGRSRSVQEPASSAVACCGFHRGKSTIHWKRCRCALPWGRRTLMHFGPPIRR